MSRPGPSVAVPNLNLSARPPRPPLLEVTLQVVTPMFGGSASPGVVDSDHPVRASSVRGHLRFWWRACNAHRWSDAKDLFAAEAAIWGQTAAPGRPGSPSAIDVEVEIDHVGENKPKPEDLHDQQWRRSDFGYPAYALFPFQRQNDPPRPPRIGRINVVFTVKLLPALHPPGLSSQQQEEVRHALCAWVLFGGVGARTRRGCGSLWCKDAKEIDHWQLCATMAQPAEQVGWSQCGGVWLPWAQVRPIPQRALPVPILPGSKLHAGPKTEIVNAWAESIRLMQTFRQAPIGRRGGQVPGRSYWPEPDSIRIEWPLIDPAHQPQHPARGTYPRADLGLPIIVQRMGEPAPRLEAGSTDPDGIKGATRMASPVILKALPVSESEAVPLVLVLNAPHVWDRALPGIKLIRGDDEIEIDRQDLRLRTDSLVPDQKNLMAANRTIRDAFIAYVTHADNWSGKEVVL